MMIAGCARGASDGREGRRVDDRGCWRWGRGAMGRAGGRRSGGREGRTLQEWGKIGWRCRVATGGIVRMRVDGEQKLCGASHKRGAAVREVRWWDLRSGAVGKGA